MTRKDYIALAEALHEAHEESGLSTGWALTVDKIANVLAADNPRFDRERFVRACQGEK